MLSSLFSMKLMRSNRQELRAALEEQDSIGWFNFLLGRISSKLTVLQDSHFKTIGGTNTGLRWTTALIKKLWDISWDMWEHRNGIAHDRAHPWKLQARQELLATAREHRSLGIESLPPEDHHFVTSDDDLDALPDETIVQYIRTVSLGQDEVAVREERTRRALHRRRNFWLNWSSTVTPNP